MKIVTLLFGVSLTSCVADGYQIAYHNLPMGGSVAYAQKITQPPFITYGEVMSNISQPPTDFILVGDQLEIPTIYTGNCGMVVTAIKCY